jgi:hypothetical protein
VSDIPARDGKIANHLQYVHKKSFRSQDNVFQRVTKVRFSINLADRRRSEMDSQRIKIQKG